MKQEEKELLVKDLCARLPYRVKVFYEYVDSLNKKTYGYSLTLNTWCIDEMKAEKAVVKPYLFPLSSMTEEQKEEHKDLLDNQYRFDANGNVFTLQDFYCKYHIDYRGCISMGLALDATGLKIY